MGTESAGGLGTFWWIIIAVVAVVVAVLATKYGPRLRRKKAPVVTTVLADGEESPETVETLGKKITEEKKAGAAFDDAICPAPEPGDFEAIIKALKVERKKNELYILRRDNLKKQQQVVEETKKLRDSTKKLAGEVCAAPKAD